MARHRQDTLTEEPSGRPARRWCRRCGRELTDPVSRRIGYGAECDPENRPGAARTHHVDQDAIPGL